MEKVAVFDIGSNAIRMAIANIKGGNPEIEKLLRIPVRLGTEVFKAEKFSLYTINYMAKIFSEFRDVMIQNNITLYRAVATSACREAINSDELKEEIYNKSSIQVEEISGDIEASMIYHAIKRVIDMSTGNYLLADIGGGSLELSLIKNGEVIARKSFDVGTVRLLEIIRSSVVDDSMLEELLDSEGSSIREFLSVRFGDVSEVELIGTGGNFRSMLKLKRRIYNTEESYITPDELSHIYNVVLKTPIIDRAKQFSLRQDRSDVILPAIGIAMLLTRCVPIDKIKCPDIGLIDGALLDSSSFHELLV